MYMCQEACEALNKALQKAGESRCAPAFFMVDTSRRDAMALQADLVQFLQRHPAGKVFMPDMHKVSRKCLTSCLIGPP